MARHYETTEKLIADLIDLHRQAMTERSHYYVASVVAAAIVEIRALKALVDRPEKKVRRVQP